MAVAANSFASEEELHRNQILRAADRLRIHLEGDIGGCPETNSIAAGR
jgi:hypothetical protein